MYKRIEKQQQNNPLMPGYAFNAYLVAGLTPIEINGPLDFFINRPSGMKGYILNLTIKGQGQIHTGEDSFLCNPGDLLLFPPKEAHFYGRSPESTSWYHRWIYFRPRGYWADWLMWYSQTNKIGRMSLSSEAVKTEFENLFIEIEEVHRSARVLSEELAMNLLERLLLRCMEEDPQSPQKILDPRVVEACQFMTSHLSKNLKIEDIATHVCLSPSRLSHLFKQQLGINILRWRDDQRLTRAKLLLHTTQESIARIGRMVGYDDQIYFSRIFKKVVGVNPTEFRSKNSEFYTQNQLI